MIPEPMKVCELTVTRTVAAPPEAVFDVWLDPRAPGGPWHGGAKVILNPVVDGLFYVAVEHAGRTWPHFGRFLRIERPSLVEYTWMSEATRGAESIVRVTFEPAGNQTQVTLQHTNVPDDELGRQHRDGWTWALSMLAERFAGGSPTGSA